MMELRQSNIRFFLSRLGIGAGVWPFPHPQYGNQEEENAKNCSNLEWNHCSFTFNFPSFLFLISFSLNIKIRVKKKKNQNGGHVLWFKCGGGFNDGCCFIFFSFLTQTLSLSLCFI